MGKITFDQLMAQGGGSGASYFSLKNGEEARVRFMYNDLNDIIGYNVHIITNPNNSSTVISCARDDGQDASLCKWCTEGHARVTRVFIPVFNLDQNKVCYWTRSSSWVRDNFVPQVQEVINNGHPISGQVFKVIRQGTGLQTTYALVMTGTADNASAQDLGEVQDPFETGMLKQSDYVLPEPTQQPSNNYQPTNNYQANNYGSYTPNQGTGRRTVDAF